jgi:hypothetical protein
LTAEELEIALTFGIFSFVFALFLCNQSFRRDFGNRIALRDPLGSQFWGNNKLFLFFTLFFIVVTTLRDIWLS